MGITPEMRAFAQAILDADSADQIFQANAIELAYLIIHAPKED